MKTMRTLLLLLSVASPLVAGTVVPIPATPGVNVDTRFTLKVNGQDVFVGEEISDGKQYSVAYFNMEGTVSIEATSTSSFSSHKVMPTRLGITATKDQNTLSFSLSQPKKVIVEVEGVGYLLLVATPLETDVPTAADPKVHYYGPGTHQVGRLKVKSNETVYIAGGARFVGTIEGEEVENVKILGRGVIDASVHTTWADRIFAVVFDRSKNIRIDGIRIREAKWWVTEFLLCEQVEISHLFVLSCLRNNSAIMVDGGNEVTARDCFLITNDDCICPHGLNAAGNGEPVGNNFLFEDCVLWQVGAGNCVRIGASFETTEVLNWTFRRIDCIGHTGAAIYADHSDWATVRNLRFIDFHDEQSTGYTINMFIASTIYSCKTGYRNERGHFDGLYFINVTSPGGGIRLNGFDADHKFDNVWFYNCKIGSNVIDSMSDLTTNAHVTNVNFVTDGSTPSNSTVEPLPPPGTESPEELIIDNTSPKFRGVGFAYSTGIPTAHGEDMHMATVPTGFSNFKAAIYEPLIAGEYDIYLHWPDASNKASNAPWIVHHADGYTTHYMNQNSSPGWHFHGRYTLDARSHVRLALPGYFSIADGQVMADAVRFTKAAGPPPPPPPPPPSPPPSSMKLNPTDDTTLRAINGNSGTNSLLLVGDTATLGDYLRGTLAFDLNIPELAGATILSARLRLVVDSIDVSSGGSQDQPNIIDLHELSASFTESGATWVSRNGSDDWTSPGGDLGPLLVSLASNAGTVSPGDSLDFTSDLLTGAVVSAVGGPLYLIAKLATEDANRSVFRFGAQNHSDTSWRPSLTIQYILPVFKITGFLLNSDTDTLTLTWTSRPGASYRIGYSRNLTHWDEDLGSDITTADDENLTDGDHITVTFDLASALLADEPRLFFRIKQV